jgi:hypothetical protein
LFGSLELNQGTFKSVPGGLSRSYKRARGAALLNGIKFMKNARFSIVTAGAAWMAARWAVNPVKVGKLPTLGV